MKRLPLAFAVAAFALVSASSAFATDQLKIDGTVTQNVNADRNTNTALGNDSVARQAFGVIDADGRFAIEHAFLYIQIVQRALRVLECAGNSVLPKR